jgi:hypothetical protein
MASKRTVTVSLDDDLVRELERGGNVPAQLNDAGWALVERPAAYRTPSCAS